MATNDESVQFETRESIERLRLARVSAKKAWKRKYSLRHIEERLLAEGFDRRTTHLTMHHLFDEFLQEFAKAGRSNLYGGVGIILVGVVLFGIAGFPSPLRNGFGPHWYVMAFGALLLGRGFWQLAQVRATRAGAHRWKSETPPEAEGTT